MLFRLVWGLFACRWWRKGSPGGGSGGSASYNNKKLFLLYTEKDCNPL